MLIIERVIAANDKPRAEVMVEVSPAGTPIDRVEILLDGVTVGTAERAPYRLLIDAGDENLVFPGLQPGPIVVVTNQSGIGRGVIAREVVDGIHRRIGERLRQQGAPAGTLGYHWEQAGEPLRAASAYLEAGLDEEFPGLALRYRLIERGSGRSRRSVRKT